MNLKQIYWGGAGSAFTGLSEADLKYRIMYPAAHK